MRSSSRELSDPKPNEPTERPRSYFCSDSTMSPSCLRSVSTTAGRRSDHVNSDLPKQELTWSDLRPAVVETLLRHEGDIVESLQKYERGRSVGSLGLGSLNSRLEDRILALGDRPKTVYEFIFGLRGDGVAVAEEFR